MMVVLPVPELPIRRRLPYLSPWRCLKIATETYLSVSSCPITRCCRTLKMSTGFMGSFLDERAALPWAIYHYTVVLFGPLLAVTGGKPLRRGSQEPEELDRSRNPRGSRPNARSWPQAAATSS